MVEESFRRYKGINRPRRHRTYHYQLRPEKIELSKFYVIVNLKPSMYRAIWNPFNTREAAEFIKEAYFPDNNNYSIMKGYKAIKHGITFLPRSKKFFERYRHIHKNIKPYFPENFVNLVIPKEFRRRKWRYHNKLKNKLLELNNYENYYLQNPREIN